MKPGPGGGAETAGSADQRSVMAKEGADEGEEGEEGEEGDEGDKGV